jgi:hypothetical protein
MPTRHAQHDKEQRAGKAMVEELGINRVTEPMEDD